MTNDISLLERFCPVCELDDFDYWFRPSQSPGPVVRCKRCGFVYVNPLETTRALIQDGPILGNRPAFLLESSILDDIKGSWEQPMIEGCLRELATKKRNVQDALVHIAHSAKNCGKLLDIGCFCGVFLSVASQTGWDCYGIEPLVMPAIYARGHYGLRVVTDTLRDDTYPSEFFDVVTSFQVFEHLIHPDQEIDKIKRILKPSGLLAIEVPNIDTTMVKLIRSRHRHFVQDHVSFFSARTLSLMLERKGFRVREIYYPTRTISLRHLIWWFGRYSRIFEPTSHILTQRYLEKRIRINLRDIVTVIAEKSNNTIGAL